MKNPSLATEQFLYNYCNVNHWLGYQMQKNPLDLIAYHNLIYDLRPDLLIETGTWHGGSALYFATLMDQLNHGVVFTVDKIDWPMRPKHERIFYLTDSSINPAAVEHIGSHAKNEMRVMVVLDSDHGKAHVLKELDLYAPMVTIGSYLVVEDTNIHGHPIRSDLPEGPWEAVHEWLPHHPEFEIDPVIEPVFSNNPEGLVEKDQMKARLKINNAPPRNPGEITVGATEEGLVIILSDSEPILFSPEQARNVAKLLMEKAKDADIIRRRLNN